MFPLNLHLSCILAFENLFQHDFVQQNYKLHLEKFFSLKHMHISLTAMALNSEKIRLNTDGLSLAFGFSKGKLNHWGCRDETVMT